MFLLPSGTIRPFAKQKTPILAFEFVKVDENRFELLSKVSSRGSLFPLKFN